MTGCKSAPELTKDNATALIQAEYDHRAPLGVTITVDQTGLKQGLAANYWKLTKVYPNNRWADYTLTDGGKKAVKLPGGGDVIQWRPEQDGSSTFEIVTVAANPYKARDVQDPADETLPGAPTAKSVEFTESVNMNGVPDPIQSLAHNPGNKLSSKRHADFTLENGQWKLHAIV